MSSTAGPQRDAARAHPPAASVWHGSASARFEQPEAPRADQPGAASTSGDRAQGSGSTAAAAASAPVMDDTQAIHEAANMVRKEAARIAAERAEAAKASSAADATKVKKASQTKRERREFRDSARIGAKAAAPVAPVAPAAPASPREGEVAASPSGTEPQAGAPRRRRRGKRAGQKHRRGGASSVACSGGSASSPDSGCDTHASGGAGGAAGSATLARLSPASATSTAAPHAAGRPQAVALVGSPVGEAPSLGSPSSGRSLGGAGRRGGLASSAATAAAAAAPAITTGAMVSPLSRVPVVTSDAALELVRRLLAEAGLEAAKVSLKAVTQGKAVRRVTSEAERVVVPGLGKVLRRLKQQQPPRLVIFARDVDGGERVASLVQQLLAESERTRARVIVAGTRAQLGAWTCRSTRNPSAPMDGGQAKAAHSCVAVCQCKALQGKVTDLFRMAETEKIAIASGISVRSEEMGAGVGGPASLSPMSAGLGGPSALAPGFAAMGHPSPIMAGRRIGGGGFAAPARGGGARAPPGSPHARMPGSPGRSPRSRGRRHMGPAPSPMLHPAVPGGLPAALVPGAALPLPRGPAQVVEFTSNGERRVRGATGEWKVVQPARPGGRVFGDDIIVSR